MSGRLHGRVALITGSSGKLGRAISILFASEGASLYLVDKYSALRNPINPDTGKADNWESRYEHKAHDKAPHLQDDQPEEETAAAEEAEEARKWMPTHEYIAKYCQTPVTFHAADLTSETQVQDAISRCAQHYAADGGADGHIDILVNAHGVSVESTHPRPLPIHETTLTDYTTTMSINSTSVFLTMKHFLAHVVETSSATASSQPSQQDQSSGISAGRQGRGRRHRPCIVNVASVQALSPYYGTSSYCASKGATLMLTKQVALDYAPLGVRCNAVCPGFLDSDMTRNLQADAVVLGGVAQRHPLVVGLGGGGDDNMSGSTPAPAPATGPGRGALGQVDDVARMVLVLAGDDARWMTGQAVVVDGGYSIS